MAEAVVSFAVERLGDQLIQEAVFLYGVREQVERLCNELRRMQCFLKDADAKQQQGDERVRNWVAEIIRDVAYDAEDVIDTFILKVASKRRGGIQEFLMRNTCIINRAVHLHNVGMEIQAILARLQDISNSRTTYGIKDIDDGEASSNANQRLQQQLRRTYPHVEDEVDVIGLEEYTKELVAELMKEEKRCRVISIVSIGGLGKTTLAKKVYRHDVVKSHFDCCAWTLISQQCSRRDVLQEILKTASALTNDEMKMIREINEEDLVEKLHSYLQEKQYLVVLDEIWSEEAWDVNKSCISKWEDGKQKDYEIPTRKLIRLWTAEGFIPQQKRGEVLTMEDVGKDQFLAELIQRCVVQVDKKSLNGRVKTCRVHDLMRDLCLSKAKEENFLDIYEYQDHHDDENAPSTNYRLRRHAIHGDKIRVLDLENVTTSEKSITKVVAKLIHLSDQLRLDNLINLQTLKRVFGGKWLKEGYLEKMTNLQTLEIYDLLRSQIEVILPGIVVRSSSSDHHNPVRSLSLACMIGDEFPNLEPLSHCHNLKLRLTGRCKSENLCKYPPNLTKLILEFNHLKEDPMATLQHLPNLMYLHMTHSYEGEEMVCSAEGFPQLQYLSLNNLSELNEWRVNQGGMPRLKHLDIYSCEELRMLPEGLRFITTLQQLEIIGMSRVFRDRVERGSGEDWYKIEHIPSIRIG
ncbi:Disease resistance protein [Macleaya cordata]|uniref:Disease resistance protein n=1 Tax=Macleaya cordata TaxID=56857 RepID=A0A200PSC5_MACCD|nr:Disease resistance protein [Macleaya cordata]